MKHLTFALLLILFSCSSKHIMMEKNYKVFDWQGHRGCRGLMPENSLPAFLHALTFEEIVTLEMDVCISKDGKVFVSHEPWMNHEIATKPNGELVSEAESMNINLYKMDYADIRAYDCGTRVHPRFLQQKKINTFKPLLSEVVEAVKIYCKAYNREIPRFNIELKSDLRGDDIYQPKPAIFAALVLKEIRKLGIYKNTILQSFDTRCLQELHKQDHKVFLALLVENEDGLEKNLQYLGFLPDIYSCYYKLLTKEVVDACHAKNIEVIPWTVNTAEDIAEMRKIGVDGIITDYPNLCSAFNR